MGLEQNSGKLIFVNIKEGKLYIKPKDSEVQFFDALSGTITKVDFAKEVFQGQEYEKAKIIIVDGDDRYQLQIRTDSGYFRGFCNSLKSGDPSKRIRVAPFYKKENDKTQTTFFVSQNEKTLKHFHTKDNPGDLPQVEEITFRGKKVWDGSKQIEYWKQWLLSIKFDHEVIAGANTTTQKQAATHVTADDITEPLDDLPF
jgi:hypothetical protein